MNKPIGQLDLIEPEATPSLATTLRDAGLTPEQTEKIIAAAGPQSADDGFDWASTDDTSIIVKPRPGVAIYENRYGDVVIRSQNTTDPDFDNFAYLQPENVPAIIKALKDYVP